MVAPINIRTQNMTCLKGQWTHVGQVNPTETKKWLSIEQKSCSTTDFVTEWKKNFPCPQGTHFLWHVNHILLLYKTRLQIRNLKFAFRRQNRRRAVRQRRLRKSLLGETIFWWTRTDGKTWIPRFAILVTHSVPNSMMSKSSRITIGIFSTRLPTIESKLSVGVENK